jgi:hypothetical protein
VAPVSLRACCGGGSTPMNAHHRPAEAAIGAVLTGLDAGEGR